MQRPLGLASGYACAGFNVHPGRPPFPRRTVAFEMRAYGGDLTEHDLSQEFGVNGYPTIRFFGEYKETPENYDGGRSEDDIVSFATIKWQDQLPPPQVAPTAPWLLPRSAYTGHHAWQGLRELLPFVLPSHFYDCSSAVDLLVRRTPISVACSLCLLTLLAGRRCRCLGGGR